MAPNQRQDISCTNADLSPVEDVETKPVIISSDSKTQRGLGKNSFADRVIMYKYIPHPHPPK